MLVARQIYYYGVAAIGLDGNGAPLSSLLSAVKTGQAYDLNPPEPPAISTLEWVHQDQDGNVYGWAESIPEELVVLSAVRVIWAADPEAQYMVQYNIVICLISQTHRPGLCRLTERPLPTFILTA